jgi:hypothetical protein
MRGVGRDLSGLYRGILHSSPSAVIAGLRAARHALTINNGAYDTDRKDAVPSDSENVFWRIDNLTEIAQIDKTLDELDLSTLE